MEQVNFQGGLWIPSQWGADVPHNALLTADNIEYLPTGSVRGRRGRTLFSTDNQYPMIALYRHYPQGGTPRWLAVFDSSIATVIRHDAAVPGVFTELTGGPAHQTGHVFHFTGWATLNKTYLANGIELLAYDGAAIAPVIMTGTQITGPYIVVHQNRLFGTVASEDNFSVYASKIGDPTQTDTQLNVSDPQGGTVAGLGTLPDRLIILKTTSLWSMLGDVKFSPILTKYSDYGVIAPNSVAFDGTGFFYVGREGIFWSDGQAPEPLEISLPLRPLFVNAADNTTYPNAFGIWYPRKQMYIVKLDPSHAYTYRCQRLLNMQHPKRGKLYLWSRNSSEPFVSAGVADSEVDNGNYIVSDTNGDLYTADTGSDDAGTPYAGTIQTPFNALAQPIRLGRIAQVELNYRSSNPATLGLRYDSHTTDDVIVPVGAVISQDVQITKFNVQDQRAFGTYVSASITLPAANVPGMEVYSVRLNPRYRSGRVLG